MHSILKYAIIDNMQYTKWEYILEKLELIDESSFKKMHIH